MKKTGQKVSTKMSSRFAFHFLVCLFFSHSTAMLCCFCVHLFLPLCQHSDRDISHLCPNRSCVFSLSFCVLIDPGHPLPMDVAPPTTAQCIQPAAPRDCPRTSLSLFPHSSSLVRRGREGAQFIQSVQILKH